MKRNIFPLLLIIALLFIGVGGQLAGTYQSPAYALSPTSFGMWEFVADKADTMQQASCVNWYINSGFDWLVRPYYTLGVPNSLAHDLNAGGKKVILRTWVQEGSIRSNRYNWTDIFNSLQGNKSLYNEALGYIVNQINENGAENLYAITISEEEPQSGYWWNDSLVNIGHFIAVHNQMYDDLKIIFPGIKVFAFVHIAKFTDSQMATLERDGLVDDVYSSNINGVMKPWFERMMRLGGDETYCIVHAAPYDPWYEEITPTVVRQTAELAQSLGVPHLGWWAYDCSVSPNRSILFNDWPACADPNDNHCQGNYKDTILDIVNMAQPTPTPTATPPVTPTPTPTETPSPTPTPTETPAPTPTPTYITGDANEDGIVNSTDLTKVERIIMGLDPATSNADVNGDGNINALDLTQIELIIMSG